MAYPKTTPGFARPYPKTILNIERFFYTVGVYPSVRIHTYF